MKGKQPVRGFAGHLLTRGVASASAGGASLDSRPSSRTKSSATYRLGLYQGAGSHHMNCTHRCKCRHVGAHSKKCSTYRCKSVRSLYLISSHCTARQGLITLICGADIPYAPSPCCKPNLTRCRQRLHAPARPAQRCQTWACPDPLGCTWAASAVRMQGLQPG